LTRSRAGFRIVFSKGVDYAKVESILES